MKSEHDELQFLLKSKFPILVVETPEGKPMETRHVVEELNSTRPLAIERREQVAALREWAADRTVPAD